MGYEARLNLKLAQRHYQDRVIELRSLILAEEERFKYASSRSFPKGLTCPFTELWLQRLTIYEPVDGITRLRKN